MFRLCKHPFKNQKTKNISILFACICFLGSFFLIKRQWNGNKYDEISLIKENGFFYIDGNVENEKIRFFINTASKFYCDISYDKIESIGLKKTSKLISFVGPSGDQGERVEYLAKSFTLGHTEIKDLPVCEQLLDLGPSLGINFFRRRKYWCFDFPSKKIYIPENIAAFMRSFRIPKKKFVDIYLEDSKPHAVFNMETSLGPRRFCLAVNADNSVSIPSDEYSEGQWLYISKIKKRDAYFEPQKMRVDNTFNTVFKFNAELGNQFLENRVIFFDFEKNQIFIGPDETPENDRLTVSIEE